MSKSKKSKTECTVFLETTLTLETVTLHLQLNIGTYMKTQHLTGKGSASSLPLANLKLMTPSDSITRCRRKIQNEENRFWPTDPKVAKARNINMESWREWANMKRDTL